MIPPTTEEKQFKLIPAGVTIARCVQVIDLGSQPSPWGAKPKVLIGWELPEVMNEPKEGEQPEPALKWKEYGLSLHPDSHLCKDINSWRGQELTPEEKKEFCLSLLLDKACMLNIVHSKGKQDPSKTYSNVDRVMNVPKGTEIAKRHHELKYFNLQKFDQEVFDTFSERLQDKIKATDEYKKAVGEFDEVQDSADGNGDIAF